MITATSLSIGPLTFTRFTAPPRAGFGVLLLTFTVWLVIELLRLCWWTAKALVVAAVLLVAVVAALGNHDMPVSMNIHRIAASRRFS
ncbi:MAG: hypothetical protein JWQ45_1142 [Blastococcus sp.]|nr:hypothetical protein [Blastococcus sp.]